MKSFTLRDLSREPSIEGECVLMFGLCPVPEEMIFEIRYVWLNGLVIITYSFCLLHGFSHLRFPYRSLGSFQQMSFCTSVFRSVLVAQQPFHIISFPRPDVWTEITMPRPRRPRPSHVSHMIFFADPLQLHFLFRLTRTQLTESSRSFLLFVRPCPTVSKRQDHSKVANRNAEKFSPFKIAGLIYLQDCSLHDADRMYDFGGGNTFCYVP